MQSVFSPAARPPTARLEGRILIRAGGLKTCWTKPLGTALPQLWALRPGRGMRECEKIAVLDMTLKRCSSAPLNRILDATNGREAKNYWRLWHGPCYLGIE